MSAARTDSDAGSVNPPAESALVTGNPNIPHTTITSVAATMTRLGAATATSAIRCRIVSAIAAGGAAGPSAMPGADIEDLRATLTSAAVRARYSGAACRTESSVTRRRETTRHGVGDARHDDSPGR